MSRPLFAKRRETCKFTNSRRNSWKKNPKEIFIHVGQKENLVWCDWWILAALQKSPILHSFSLLLPNCCLSRQPQSSEWSLEKKTHTSSSIQVQQQQRGFVRMGWHIEPQWDFSKLFLWLFLRDALWWTCSLAYEDLPLLPELRGY